MTYPNLLIDYLSLRLRQLLPDERGEGVISAAIAVLVMAFLGAAMWLAFSEIFDNATETVGNQIEQIGNG
jgi:hypothetical protein